MSAPNQHRDVQARVLFCLPNLQPQRAVVPVAAGSRARHAATAEQSESPHGERAADADQDSQPMAAASATSQQNAAAMAFTTTSYVDPGSPNPPPTSETSVYQSALDSCRSAVEYAWSGGGQRLVTPLAIVVVVFAAWALGRQSASRSPVSDTPVAEIATTEKTAEQAVEETADESPSGALLAAAVAARDKQTGLINRVQPTEDAKPNRDATADIGIEANAVDDTDAANEDDSADEVAVADGGFYLPEDADSLDITSDPDDQLAEEIERAAERATIAYRLAVRDTPESPAAVEQDPATEEETEATVVQVASQVESDAVDKTAANEVVSDTAAAEPNTAESNTAESNTAEANTAEPAAEAMAEPQPRPRLSTTPNAVPDWSRYIPGAHGYVRAASADSDPEDEAAAIETPRQAIFLNEGPWADNPAISR